MRKRTELFFERLEDRRLLAGDVHVLVNDNILLVVGDAMDNQVEISRNDAGDFVVGGTDTTINRQSEPLVFEGDSISNVTIALKNGDDVAVVSNVAVPSNFSFYGGRGNDTLITTDLAAYHMHLEGNTGDDLFEIDFETRKSAYLYLGGGHDVVSSNRIVAGRNLKIYGDTGSDTFSADTLLAARKLEFDMDSGDDSILLSGRTGSGRSARFKLGDGNDFLGILPGRNGDRAEFRGLVSLDDGSGNDHVSRDSRVQVKGPLVGSFGSTSNGRLTDLIDEVFRRLDEAGSGEEEPFVPLDATISDTTLEFSEDSAPVAIAPAFGLTGSETVTGATIQISNFAAGQEILSFFVTGNISGNFDDLAGILTLAGSASTASYQSAIRTIQYQNTSDDPITDLRTFDINITTSSETDDVSRDFQVIASDDPTELVPGTADRIIEPADLPVLIDNQLVITDPDTANITSAEVRFDSGFVIGEDVLSSVDSLGITSSFDAATGTLTLTGDAVLAEWQTVLRTVEYTNGSANPTQGTRTIRITLNGPLTDFAIYRIDLQQAIQPNTFTVSESAANGTVLGQVTTTGTFQTPMIYQFEQNLIPVELLLNADDHTVGDPRASVVLIEYLDFQ